MKQGFTTVSNGQHTALFVCGGGRSDQWWTLGLGFEWRWVRIDYARIYEPDFASDFISAELRF